MVCTGEKKMRAFEEKKKNHQNKLVGDELRKKPSRYFTAPGFFH